MISGKYKTILSDTIISIAIVQLTAACMVSAAMTEVEAGSKDKHVALVSKAYLVLLLHILVEPTLKSKACLKCLYFTKIISALCCYLEYFSYLYTIN